MKKLIIFSLICMVLVIGGFIWGIYDYASIHNISTSEVTNIIANYLTPKEPPIIKPPEPVIPPPTPPKPPQPVIPPPPPPKPPKPSMSEDAARQIIADAENDYKQFNFDESAEKLKKVIKGNTSPILTKQAGELRRKVNVFNTLLNNMPRENLSDLNGLIEIQFNTGQPIIAKLIEEKKTYIIAKQDGIEKEIPLREITCYVKLTPEEYKSKLRSEYQTKLSRLTNPTAQDYYQITTFCYKKQLDPETLLMLELAWGKDEQLLISLSGKSPEPLIDPNQTVVPENQVALAYEYYKNGKDHLDKTLNKGPDFDKENELAKESFKSALAIYRELQEIKPNDSFLEGRITEIEQYLLYIRKQTPIKRK